jgi:hypothetical protein
LAIEYKKDRTIKKHSWLIIYKISNEDQSIDTRRCDMKILALLTLVTLNVVAIGLDSVFAGQVGTLIEFEPHTPAKAGDVNANFNAVATAVNDNDNRLSAMSNGYVSVSAITAVPWDSTFETNVVLLGENGIGRYAVSPGHHYLIAPVFIPDGATIISLSYTCYDNAASYDSSVILYRDGTEGLIAEVVSTSSSSTTAQTVSTTDIINPIVDNSLYGYHVHMEIDGSAGANLAPIRVVIEYALD